jgi:hypothetical protein
MSNDANAHEHQHESDLVRVERDQSPTWIVRLAMALIGVVLLGGAVVAYRMHWAPSGELGVALPWIIVLAVLLGAGAVIESITRSVWITLLGGIFAVLVAYAVTGTYIVNLDATTHAVFVVDRYTGETHYCNATECRTVSDGVNVAALKKLKDELHTSARP